MNFKNLKAKIEKVNGSYDSLNYNLDRYAQIAETLIRMCWVILKDDEIKAEKENLLKLTFLKNIDKLTDEELEYYAMLQLARRTAVAVSLWEDFPEARTREWE